MNLGMEGGLGLAGVPLKRMVMRSGETPLTANPWLASQLVMVAMSAGAGPNWSPICWG